jgi:dihydrofolate reductase
MPAVSPRQVTPRRIVVHIATSADGFIARPDGDIDWLTDRPEPEGFYGLPEFARSIGGKILGRKTFDTSIALGQQFSVSDPHYVFTRHPPPPSPPAGVHFVMEPIAAFVNRMRAEPGKDLWLMGGGEIIGEFLDGGAVDEFIISVVPVFIGEGIPLIAPRHLRVPLRLVSVQGFPDGVVQSHYQVIRDDERS